MKKRDREDRHTVGREEKKKMEIKRNGEGVNLVSLTVFESI